MKRDRLILDVSGVFFRPVFVKRQRLEEGVVSGEDYASERRTGRGTSVSFSARK
jgi:hypothetical protein